LWGVSDAHFFVSIIGCPIIPRYFFGFLFSIVIFLGTHPFADIGGYFLSILLPENVMRAITKFFKIDFTALVFVCLVVFITSAEGMI